MFLFEILVFKLGYLSGIFSEGIKHICHFKENKCHFKENNYYFLLIIRLDLHNEDQNLKTCIHSCEPDIPNSNNGVVFAFSSVA